MTSRGNKSTSIVAIAFALLCGCSGILAGIFEILQGNAATDGLIISTIGPDYSMWSEYVHGELMETYSAFTIVPNFLFTGILAIISSLAVIIWSLFFIQKKHGALIFLILSFCQFIVGGSFVLDMALITFFVATRINKPLKWWKAHLPAKLRNILVSLWPWALILYILIALMLLGITVFGINNPDMHKSMDIAAGLMFVPLILMIIGGFAWDIKRQDYTIAH